MGIRFLYGINYNLLKTVLLRTVIKFIRINERKNCCILFGDENDPAQNFIFANGSFLTNF